MQDIDEIDIYILPPLGSKCYRTQYDSIKKKRLSLIVYTLLYNLGNFITLEH